MSGTQTFTPCINVCIDTGNVVGPGASVDERIATFDGITGKLIQDGGVTTATVITTGVVASLGTANASNGYGSSNTNIMLWQAVADVGAAFTWTESAADGDYITVATEGIYSISLTISNSVGAGLFAINTAATLSNTFDGTHMRAVTDIPASDVGNMSWTGHIPAGAVIWASSNAALAVVASATQTQITVSKFGQYAFGT